MANDLKLYVRTADQTRHAELTLERSRTGADIIQAAVDNWRLPAYTDYALVNATTGRALAPDATLAASGIKEGDVLEVRAALARQLAAADAERGGLLVGRVYDTHAGDGERRPALVLVRAAAPSLDDAATAVSLRMEAGVWSRARDEAMRDGELIVGWYHSHPGLGAFFSARDRETQRAFFHHPFSLGWVIDPARGEEKWFRGPESEELAPACVLTRA